MNIMANMSVSIAVFTIVVLAHGTFIAATKVGGKKEIKDVNKDEGAKKALDSAVDHFNRMTNDMYLREVTEVLSAEVQVVSGVMYYFTLNMARTNCTKGSVNNVCAIQQEPQNAKVSTCEIEVWSRPWLNSSQSTIVTIKKCN